MLVSESGEPAQCSMAITVPNDSDVFNASKMKASSIQSAPNPATRRSLDSAAVPSLRRAYAPGSPTCAANAASSPRARFSLDVCREAASPRAASPSLITLREAASSLPPAPAFITAAAALVPSDRGCEQPYLRGEPPLVLPNLPSPTRQPPPQPQPGAVPQPQSQAQPQGLPQRQPRPLGPAQPQHWVPPGATATAPPEEPVMATFMPPAMPVTRLVAVNPGAPGAMHRGTWCMEDYLVTKRLCKTATCSVYMAQCLHSSLPVALKVYHLDRVPANCLHMLRREVKIQASLCHKHVVTLYGAFQDLHAQRLVLVQEFAGNGDLHDVQRALGGRLTEAQVRTLVLQPLLEAVSYMHGAGIVHRDLKPDNILFTSDWRLVVADFGIAINAYKERPVTRAGTVGYMAPEVTRCPIKDRPEDNKDAAHLAYTPAVDIWAVGVLAYELLVGFPPFVAGSKPRPRALGFPGSTSSMARDFVTSALAESAGERPTALQLLDHPWMWGDERHSAINV
ncbi:hypothetical protein HYH03_009809 [Edaphochlamys debaryana]|uniref:Protein kinase domain-containing protein n=1 Tax=Edaphochlamys debaryana TaxID=47281 RepID=A0A835XX57_9CHLO|nr:hypothetical protein HYH03_009809 [Edaphochlamys debaryana]|eukprot:KAG2491853.1 hypothetical protein HYH03_009809 [Edaphochlamys debaryana]